MSWSIYYQKNKDRELRPLYKRAIKFIEPTATKAIDLGCGTGTEVVDLLKRGLIVHAVDKEPQAFEFLKSQIEDFQEKFHPHLSALENLKIWPQVDFLFAYHSFPFCKRESFRSVLKKALNSLSEKGVFAASFFGLEDEWAIEDKVIGIGADEIRNQLHKFEILHLEDTKKTNPSAFQGNKMWNIIEVIAKKNF